MTSTFPPRVRWVVMALGMLLLAATADYLTGYELLFYVFYLAAVSLATWFGGWMPGLLLSIISVACSLLGDLASGARYNSSIVPWWNMGIALLFYLAMVLVLAKLRAFQQSLEDRVAERTRELEGEIQQRERLEAALLDASEKEQRRIGHDLHDSLCQHLTGTALAAEVVAGRLEESHTQEAEQVRHVVAMVEEGIDVARSLARGLAPEELDMEGLSVALRELAETASQTSGITCRLAMEEQVLLNDSLAITQLFRIAQEAVRNAIRHSEAREIVIGLTPLENGVRLTVQDDGSGLPAHPGRSGGMGLNIMRYRAGMIGALFRIERLSKGTLITVTTAPA